MEHIDLEKVEMNLRANCGYMSMTEVCKVQVLIEIAQTLKEIRDTLKGV